MAHRHLTAAISLSLPFILAGCGQGTSSTTSAPAPATTAQTNQAPAVDFLIGPIHTARSPEALDDFFVNMEGREGQFIVLSSYVTTNIEGTDHTRTMEGFYALKRHPHKPISEEEAKTLQIELQTFIDNQTRNFNAQNHTDEDYVAFNKKLSDMLLKKAGEYGFDVSYSHTMGETRPTLDIPSDLTP